MQAINKPNKLILKMRNLFVIKSERAVYHRGACIHGLFASNILYVTFWFTQYVCETKKSGFFVIGIL